MTSTKVGDDLQVRVSFSDRSQGKNSAQVPRKSKHEKISYGKQIFRKNVQSERIKNKI